MPSMKVLSMRAVGGLQAYGICSRRLVYSEVVETRSDYKNFTSGDIEIPFVGARLGVTRLKKTWLVYLLGLFEGTESDCDLDGVKLL